MLTTDLNFVETISERQQENETSQKNYHRSNTSSIFQGMTIHPGNSKEYNQESLKSKIQRNRISLQAKDQVQSLSQNESTHSQEMDIDEENDFVNELSYIEELKKDDEEDQLFANLSSKDRILYANSKKHQGNEFFKQHNLQQAIESYKFALSLLKPQSFVVASPQDYLAMAELTSNVLYNMGTCYFILMSYRYAIKFYDQAILIKPNYVKAIHNRALCFLEEGNFLLAYEDIKLASQLDIHTVSIQNDRKKIENQYHSTYRSHSQKNLNHLLLDIPAKKDLSRSMIEPNLNDMSIDPQTNTSNSMICNQQKPRSNLQTKSQKQNSRAKTESYQKESLPNIPKQRVRNFYGRKFFQNQLKSQKSNKYTATKTLLSQTNPSKFRPYLLNRTSRFLDQKSESESLYNSAGQFFERQKRVNLLNQRIQDKYFENEQNQNNEKFKVRKSRQKFVKDKNENYWGYLPIMVATGIGLYHSLKAVLGK